mmetsp:Transcript_15768/g.26008  ORF Transcript_15768/g.26008 Transcript_15768/m.26008 type:complete len:358 (-) Transcript_15768:99-1172(-)
MQGAGSSKPLGRSVAGDAKNGAGGRTKPASLSGALILNLDGSLIFQPYGSKSQKRRYIQYMAWKETARSYGIEYKFSDFRRFKNEEKTTEEIFAFLAKEQGREDINCKDASIAKKNNYNRISSGIPIKPIVEAVRKASQNHAIVIISSRSQEHIDSSLQKLGFGGREGAIPFLRTLPQCVITEPLLSQLVKQYDLPVSTSSKGDGRGGGGRSKVVVYDCNDSSLSAAKAVGMGTFDVRSVFDFPTDTLGDVAWYDTSKGYGFISPKVGGKDLFVHQSSIRASGFRFLQRGERVQYTVGTNKKGETVALNVRAPHGKVLACSMPNSSASSQGDTKKNDGFSNGRENRQQSRNENSMEI